MTAHVWQYMIIRPSSLSKPYLQGHEEFLFQAVGLLLHCIPRNSNVKPFLFSCALYSHCAAEDMVFKLSSMVFAKFLTTIKYLYVFGCLKSMKE